MVMKKMIMSMLLLSALTACGTAGVGSKNPFKYDRKEACEIQYGQGQNSISVIVDGNKILVKNNRQVEFGSSVLSVNTPDGSYMTPDRYFSDSESFRLAKSLQNSKKVYLRWQKVGATPSDGPAFTTTVDTSNFPTEFKKCVDEQGLTQTTAPAAEQNKTWLKVGN
jgi:hypothetical protein